MEDLRKARAEHNLDRRLRIYLAPKVLVVDEFGIWPYDRDSATAFFTLVSARYERGSVILTSNKGFGERGEFWGTPSLPRRCWTGCCTTATCWTSEVRATGSGRNARLGSSAHITCSALARRTPTTTTRTDEVAGH